MRIARMIASLFLAAFLLLLPCLLLIDHAVPVFGYSFHAVLTGSMTPTLEAGDIAIVRHCRPEDVQVGDVIMFAAAYYPPVSVPSRVRQVITELNGEQGVWLDVIGDWSNTSEPIIISEKNLIGKVTGRIPGIGLVVGFMRTPLGTIMMLLVCWAAAVVIVLPVLRKRRGHGHT